MASVQAVQVRSKQAVTQAISQNSMQKDQCIAFLSELTFVPVSNQPKAELGGRPDLASHVGM